MVILNEEQAALRSAARAFTDKELIPAAAELERGGTFPAALLRRCGELGFTAAALMDEGRYDAVKVCIILEELSRGSAALALALLPQYLACDILCAAGEPFAALLKRGQALETLFAYAISEESGGSDVLGIDTTAIYDGGEWVLNGAKSWITNAGAANAYIVAARTAFSGRSRNMSLFCVDGAAAGLSVTAEELIGMRGCPHGTVSFSNCRIPGRSLIGGEDQGYRLLKPTLLLGRLGVSAIAVGIAKRALELAAAYATSTGKYGRRLSTYQGISFALADMYAKTAGAKSAVYCAAEQYMQRAPQAAVNVAAAKLMSTELACEVTKSARQIHGANGLSRRFEVERCLRDAQMLTIAEGTSEICKIIIASSLTSGGEWTI